MNKIAVVILNWNGLEVLRRFLPAVVERSQGDGVDVVVADNASTDESVAWIQASYPQVRLILLPENYGFAEGYNRALAKVEAEYVVLLNNDVEVTAGWLAPLLAYMDAHPEVAACQPKILSERNRELFEYAGASGGYLDKFGYPFCRGRLFEHVEKDEGQYDAVAPVLWASGAALFVRLKDYLEAGGLDARFFAHMEEIDFCWRLRSRGRKLVCIPQSVVYHVGAATLQQGSPRKTFLNFRNNLLMLYKNLPERELRKVLAVRLFLDGLAALVFLLKGEYPHAKAVIQARWEYRRMRPSYAEVRSKNRQCAVGEEIPERVSYSILWKVYVGRKTRFSQLPPLKD